MKLKNVHVQLYRNIVDSNTVSIDEKVTCLVGKNESGKTSFLQALYSLNPAYPSTVKVDITMDYPRWRKVRDDRSSILGDVRPIKAEFLLEPKDINQLSSLLPISLPTDITLIAFRDYNSELHLLLRIDEAKLAKLLIDNYKTREYSVSNIKETDSLSSLLEILSVESKSHDGRTASSKAVSEFEEEIRFALDILNNELSGEAHESVKSIMPKLFYFSEYSPLRGRIDLTDLLGKDRKHLNESEQTALALLELVGVEGKEFMETEFEVRIAELEAAANEVTRQVFDYWTQNTDLNVELQGDSETVSASNGQSTVHRYVDIRLNDLRHQISTNFEARSSGFQWFFSFIVAFSSFENDPNVIILLDEPGLGLHARAQADLLKFIEERLSSTSQVIYTSHSPFTVNPKHLDRVRLVEDLSSRENPDIGSKISEDVLSVKSDTLFPLQAALGYDLTQTLFVGSYNLIVEGPSDLLYLMIFSNVLSSQNRTILDERFTIVPVGGADKIPTFAALLGAHLDFTILLDGDPSRNQKLQDMVQKGILVKQRLIGISQITQTTDSNIEDLFTPSEYLRFYNSAFSTNLNVNDLTGNDSIIRRIERHRGSKFDHLKPSITLLQNTNTLLPRIADSTLQRFEDLYVLLNGTIE